ncbi:g2789 [Coccomyxa viridis]|uniref:G2789 protein n=1 Tax=Coccomyxa viridis TaxID=1274662 RepID=A0ABP1FP83_9CHLO
MKTEECKRLQEQQTAFSALVSTLEADLSAANASMSDVRSMVMENSHAMKEQKAWIQKSMVREEHLVEKLDELVAALAAERQQHSKTKESLSSEVATAAALLKEKDRREGKVNELLAERAALRKELGQQKEHHAQAQQHLRRSNDLLQSATVAVRSHEAALASMKGKLAAIHSSTAQRAADNAALLAKQERELALLRTEVAALKDSHTESLTAVARSNVTKTAPAPPLRRPEGAQGAQHDKDMTEDRSSQSQSRNEKMPGDTEEEKANLSPANSQGRASPDSQSRVCTSKDQNSAGGTAKEVDSLPHMPAAQQSSSAGAHASGKRQRPLQHTLLSSEIFLQPAADTPDELEVVSDIHGSTVELESPAKKPCLQPMQSKRQGSTHSQLSPDMERLGSRDMGASEKGPAQQQIMPLSSSREAELRAAPAPESNGSVAMLIRDGGHGASAPGMQSIQVERDKGRTPAQHSKPDLFNAFAAFDCMGEGP